MVLKSVLKIEQTVSTAFFSYLPIMPFHPGRWVRLIKHDWSLLSLFWLLQIVIIISLCSEMTFRGTFRGTFRAPWVSTRLKWNGLACNPLDRDPWSMKSLSVIHRSNFALNPVSESGLWISQPTWSFWPLRLSLENQYMSCREVSGRFSMLYFHNTQNHLELSLHEVTTFISCPLLIISVL